MDRGIIDENRNIMEFTHEADSLPSGCVMALLMPVVTLLVCSRLKPVAQGVCSCYIIRLVLRRFNCRLQSVLASCKEESLKG